MANNRQHHVRNITECYEVAQREAARYQELINKGLKGILSPGERAILTAKRDAASRIARLIKYGTARNHVHGVKDEG